MLKHRESVIYNGKFYYTNQIPIDTENRAFLYGDAVFETIFVSDMRIPFLTLHLKRLRKAADILQYRLPNKFSNPEVFTNEILRLLNRNKHYKGARVTLNVFRETGGLYTPDSNQINYLIRTKALPQNYFLFNPNGIKVDVYQTHKIHATEFTPFKISGNSRVHILAGIHKLKAELDDCIILNQDDNIVETISSNIFIIKDKHIITPPVSDGCIAGIIRSLIPDLAKELSYTYSEESLTLSDIKQADELFISNTINGIQSVKAVNKKRYFSTGGKQFSDALNRLLPLKSNPFCT